MHACVLTFILYTCMDGHITLHFLSMTRSLSSVIIVVRVQSTDSGNKFGCKLSNQPTANTGAQMKDIGFYSTLHKGGRG